METTILKHIGPKDCPYTLKGRNLAEVRRFKIIGIATALDIKATGSKDEMLTMIIAKLNAMESEKELSDLKPKVNKK